MVKVKNMMDSERNYRCPRKGIFILFRPKEKKNLDFYVDTPGFKVVEEKKKKNKEKINNGI